MKQKFYIHFFKLIVIYFLIIIPHIAFADKKSDEFFGNFLMAIAAGPYYIYAFIIFVLQIINKGREKFLSLVIYILCTLGISFAYFQGSNGYITFYEIDTFFIVCSLPFFIIIILEIIASRNQSALRKREQEESEFQDT